MSLWSIMREGDTSAAASLTGRPPSPAGKKEALRLLASHGITMLPVEDASTVPAALTSGKAISLTGETGHGLTVQITGNRRPSAQRGGPVPSWESKGNGHGMD